MKTLERHRGSDLPRQPPWPRCNVRRRPLVLATVEWRGARRPRMATHSKLEDERLAILSQDWLHTDHNTTKT